MKVPYRFISTVECTCTHSKKCFFFVMLWLVVRCLACLNIYRHFLMLAIIRQSTVDMTPMEGSYPYSPPRQITFQKRTCNNKKINVGKIEHRATGSRRLMSALTFLLTFASPSNGVIRICKDDVIELQYYCNKDAINGMLLQ